MKCQLTLTWQYLVPAEVSDEIQNRIPESGLYSLALTEKTVF